MLTLFSQLPTNTKFRFENTNAGPVFIKTNEAGAHHDGAFQKVSPSVLVFRVKPTLVSVTFHFLDASRHVADPTDDGKWRLDADYEMPGQVFNTLEDVIHHLES